MQIRFYIISCFICTVNHVFRTKIHEFMDFQTCSTKSDKAQFFYSQILFKKKAHFLQKSMFSSPLLASTIIINYFWTIYTLSFYNMEPEVKPGGKFFPAEISVKKKQGRKYHIKVKNCFFFTAKSCLKKTQKFSQIKVCFYSTQP